MSMCMSSPAAFARVRSPTHRNADGGGCPVVGDDGVETISQTTGHSRPKRSRRIYAMRVESQESCRTRRRGGEPVPGVSVGSPTCCRDGHALCRWACSVPPHSQGHAAPSTETITAVAVLSLETMASRLSRKRRDIHARNVHGEYTQCALSLKSPAEPVVVGTSLSLVSPSGRRLVVGTAAPNIDGYV